MECDLQSSLAFYGHSMGALISFELAREISRRHGILPREMFLSGHRAPPAPPRELRNLSDDEFIARLRKFNGTPNELLDDPEARELFLPSLRADFEVVDSYQYIAGEALPCPITAYGGLQDADVPVEGLYAWQKHTSGRCKVRMLPGGHFFIQTCNAEFMNILRRDIFATLHDPDMRMPEVAALVSG
jgi:medium-chain acyl-[acyl-carrier-protein] hydrolase